MYYDVGVDIKVELERKLQNLHYNKIPEIHLHSIIKLCQQQLQKPTDVGTNLTNEYTDKTKTNSLVLTAISTKHSYFVYFYVWHTVYTTTEKKQRNVSINLYNILMRY